MEEDQSIYHEDVVEKGDYEEQMQTVPGMFVLILLQSGRQIDST